MRLYLGGEFFKLLPEIESPLRLLAVAVVIEVHRQRHPNRSHLNDVHTLSRNKQPSSR